MGQLRKIVLQRATAALKEDTRKMVRILHCNIHIKTLSNLNATWHPLVFVRKEKICTIFRTNSIDLT